LRTSAIFSSSPPGALQPTNHLTGPGWVVYNLFTGFPGGSRHQPRTCSEPPIQVMFGTRNHRSKTALSNPGYYRGRRWRCVRVPADQGAAPR
jgi:hypothetical protein